MAEQRAARVLTPAYAQKGRSRGGAFMAEGTFSHDEFRR